MPRNTCDIEARATLDVFPLGVAEFLAEGFLEASQNSEQLCFELSEVVSVWPKLSSEVCHAILTLLRVTRDGSAGTVRGRTAVLPTRAFLEVSVGHLEIALVLTVIITVAAMRRWVIILRTPAPPVARQRDQKLEPAQVE